MIKCTFPFWVLPESSDFETYLSTDYFNQGNMNKVMQNTIKPFSDLLDLVYTLQHSFSIHWKIMSISKKQNKLTSLFISYYSVYSAAN